MEDNEFLKISIMPKPALLSALAIVGVVTISITAHSQATSSGIRVLSNAQISTDNPKRPHFESSLAVDPKDPPHMLATSTVAQGRMGASFPYVSFDGGRTWKRGHAASGNDTLFKSGMGDALVYIDHHGTAFF